MSPSMIDIMRDLGSIEIPRKPVKCRRSWVWKPPNSGFLKINVNGSFLCSFGRGGIWDLIRNSKGKVVIQFCSELRVDSTIHAKVLTLRKGLLVAMASQWASTQ